ncbi:MAG: DegT/DnrJ/EryC1/StrS family aminotransferase [Mariprofundaceae bacterium]
MIPHSRPVFGQTCSDTVQKVIATGQLAKGDVVSCLETEVANRIGTMHAVAVDSGTSGLMLAIRALGTKHSIKTVGIPAYACASLFHAVRGAGCEPVCMDCGDDLRLLPDQALEQAKAMDAVIVVHPFGMVEPMITADWPCPVIEDIAQAAGSVWQGKAVGSFGDMSVASFYATKPWGGAYGGMVLSNDSAYCDVVSLMSDPDAEDDSLDYVGHHLLSDVHAVLVLERLKVADAEQSARRSYAKEMDRWFISSSSINPIKLQDQGSMYRYIVRLDDGAEKLLDCLQAQGIGAARPVKEPLSRRGDVSCPGAEKASNDCVSLPLLNDFSDQEWQQMKKAISACM